jgi:hypothetical protein
VPEYRTFASMRALLLAFLLIAAVFAVHAGTPAAAAEGGPVDIDAPEVEAPETVAVGARLSCNPGSWIRTGSFTYEWYANGIPVGSERVYRLTAADKGKSVMCIVTGHSGSESESEASWNAVELEGSGHKSGSPPVNVTPPEVTAKGKSGEVTSVEAGQELECERGTWSGEPAPTFSYEWLRDGSDVQDGQGRRRSLDLVQGHGQQRRWASRTGEQEQHLRQRRRAEIHRSACRAGAVRSRAR